MKKMIEKKLNLGKIKVADLSKKTNSSGEQFITQIGCTGASVKITCISQGAPICSEDSCRF
ncbi:hypothetical protein COR50_19600 [Chitinophaga caeni]|uniref:Uncharacterized protein n=1 Tax=Chitinophaga caeni TaxID=2029983 RepID=A0A291QZ14_9BACT|nr:hypothetical protein [Chitinophaga caeni]ATL49200.1 hypothetical protein COR50_19600 [Chitinophaga caeni]